jgi:outer membrane protein assembly factor BamE (lipoprotein component of BamABCDE complex)
MAAKSLLLVALLAFTFGCAHAVTEGRKIDSAQVGTLRIDQPKADVVQTFGDPLKIELLPSGELKYKYRYYSLTPHWFEANEVEKQDLEIIFNTDHTVQSYNYKTSESDPAVRSSEVYPK